MGEPKKLMLCFSKNNREYLDLALSYWKGHVENGRWIWDRTVQDISQAYRIDKRSVLELVTQSVTAVDTAVRCSDCTVPKILASRAAFTEGTSGRYIGGEYICDTCARKRMEIAEAEAQEVERNLTVAQAKIVSEQSGGDHLLEYCTLSYADIVIVYAILQSSDQACENGEFSINDLHLCPTTKLASDLVGRLFNRGVLRFSAATPLNSISIENDRTWSYFPQRVRWRLALDSDHASYAKLMSLLGEFIDEREESQDFAEGVSELWNMLAFDDATAFLEKTASEYRLDAFKAGPKTEEAIRHALSRFSIPQVRREILNVVKNAAALSVNRQFVKGRAMNTIPGNLISYVDRAVSESWTVYPILHDWTNEEATLITVLFNRVLGTGLSGFKTLCGASLQERLYGLAAT